MEIARKRIRMYLSYFFSPCWMHFSSFQGVVPTGRWFCGTSARCRPRCVWRKGRALTQNPASAFKLIFHALNYPRILPQSRLFSQIWFPLNFLFFLNACDAMSSLLSPVSFKLISKLISRRLRCMVVLRKIKISADFNFENEATGLLHNTSRCRPVAVVGPCCSCIITPGAWSYKSLISWCSRRSKLALHNRISPVFQEFKNADPGQWLRDLFF